MPKIDDLTPSAGELISDCILSLERALADDGKFIGRTLAQLVLSNLVMARDQLARHISSGYLRRRQ